MSNELLAMEHVRQIILFLKQGLSQRRISRELKLSRTTVSRYIERINTEGKGLADLLNLEDSDLSLIAYPQAKQSEPDERKTDFEERTAYFFTELKRTGVTRQLLWEEYKSAYPQGYGYSKFCELLIDYQKVRNATMHFNYSPGEIMMVDFAGDKINYIDRESGELIYCQVLVCVLPFSGYSYVIALPDATLPQLIKGLNQSLIYFKGVPLNIKCDNMKQMVSKSNHYEPLFTEAIEQWANHYHVNLLAARVRKPRDKALVENEVKLTYQRIYAPLRDQQFFSLEHLNASIVKQLTVHHALPFQRKDYSRLDRFNLEEQPVLQSLSTDLYELNHKANAKVQKNYHITLGEDWNHYSVPYNYIGKKVQVVYNTDTVQIYHELTRIALHKRSLKKHDYITVKEHMPEGHQRYSEQKGWDADYFLAQAKKVGTCTYQYIGLVLKGKYFPEQTYKSCLGLLQLGKKHGECRLESACKRALKGNAYNYHTINNILINNLDKAEEQLDLFTMPQHGNIRGPQAYQN